MDENFEFNENNIEDINIYEEPIIDEFEQEFDESEEDFSDDTENLNAIYNFHTNKHKREGKHSLKRDVIFYGKANKKQDEDYETSESTSTSPCKMESGSLFEFEYRNNEEYVNQKQLSNDVLDVLSQYTQIDFTSNRRKPNKQTFNEYFILLLTHLKTKYTYSELFVELAYYFTDNIFNIFKILDKKYATIIIKELKAKGYLKDLDNINFI